ncbi:WD domain, G-beta repeat protein [Ancylostoma duodenale]|uniref:WD domain, G-beta repeat protein n=2 Tax=Ancylostoma TaxID=29169 RepID=A0A0C2H552_9BILA|nr:WD domain, G-beta repeat protein [Ancylostoma duodenale]
MAIYVVPNLLMSVEVQAAPNAAEDGNLPEKQGDDGEGGIQQPDQMQKTLLNLVFRSMKRTHDMFSNDYTTFPELSENDLNALKSIKKRCEYGSVIRHVEEAKKRREQELLKLPASQPSVGIGSVVTSSDGPLAITDGTGHTGWVRAVDVEPQNQWFASGGGDRIIKIWDLASGKLRLSLTGHISAVRAVKVSPRHPFLFSGGEDKQVKCWDLEYNKVIRHYHGHLSAVQALSIHPTLDVLITCARDSTARVWDMRTKAQVHCLSGHTNTVSDVVSQAAEPQKSVRSLVLHPRLYMFASASPDNIKQWKFPKGEFMQNLSGHNAIVNSLVCNEDGVLVSGGDNGSICFWDWRSGFCFQKIQTKPQPGSIDSEAGIYAMCYDKTGLRLITGEADKTIKMYKEDDEATEETHPIVWRPEIVKKKAY